MAMIQANNATMLIRVSPLTPRRMYRGFSPHSADCWAAPRPGGRCQGRSLVHASLGILRGLWAGAFVYYGPRVGRD